MFAKLHRYISFADISHFMADVEAKFLVQKLYWTPAKTLLLADVDEYSFANAKFNGACCPCRIIILVPDF